MDCWKLCFFFHSFYSKILKAGCAILAFQRFKAGGETAFTTDTIPEDGVPADTYNEAQYAQAPFNGGENPGDDFQKFWTTKKETSLQKDANQSQSKVLGVSRKQEKKVLTLQNSSRFPRDVKRGSKALEQLFFFAKTALGFISILLALMHAKNLNI